MDGVDCGGPARAANVPARSNISLFGQADMAWSGVAAADSAVLYYDVDDPVTKGFGGKLVEAEIVPVFGFTTVLIVSFNQPSSPHDLNPSKVSSIKW
ncbi:hypothetical protein RUND412_003171 [Rhizina undulata]